MPSEGKLLISVTAEVDGDDVIVSVSDNGVGMTEEARLNILHPESSTGLGIAGEERARPHLRPFRPGNAHGG